MRTPLLRLVASFAALFVAIPPASAQIQWNVTYADQTANGGAGNGIGFDDQTIFSGTLTYGQVRRDSVATAYTYLNTVLDGRGSVNLTFNVSFLSGTGSLASFGPQQFVTLSGTSLPGSFQNGGVYQAARTNDRIWSDTPDGSGQFNFGYGWNYAGQSANPNNFDMVTVAIHEIAHSLGFLSNLNPDGRGPFNGSVGSPNAYSGLDRFLQRGNGPTGSLFNTDITSPGYSSFLGPLDTLYNGNDPSTGLFFGGPYAREVKGGAVPMFAPGSWDGGSSVSHVNDGNAVMNPNIAPNSVKRFLRYEVAMLLDIGWNVYNWDDAPGNWKDGINANGSFTLSSSNWRTDSGIVFSAGSPYNIHSDQGQAPVLAPYGQVTSNIVLNFGGSGSSPYTSTNDLGAIRLARLNLDSSSAAANTLAGGTLTFGVDSDGSASVLTPRIVQKNSGAFAVNSDIHVTDTTAAPGGGWAGLTVDGPGSGQLTLGGAISGTGTLTKAGGFTLRIAGPAANTYSGLTTVAAGTLLLDKAPGRNAVGASLTVAGGTVRLAAPDQLPDSGVVTLAGGTLSTGSGAGFSDAAGPLEVTADSAIALGTGAHALRFTGFADATLAGRLTVTGWAGDPHLGGGTAGRILVSDVSGDPNATYAAWLTGVQFQGYAQGGIFLATSTAGTYELVATPTPEPAAVLAIAFGTFVAVGRWRRRLARPHPRPPRPPDRVCSSAAIDAGCRTSAWSSSGNWLAIR